jgi:dTMP kinase
VEIGLARRQAAGDVNRLDAAGLNFHRDVRRGYQQLAHAEPERWRIIDATRPLAEVTAETVSIVEQWLAR